MYKDDADVDEGEEEDGEDVICVVFCVFALL